MTVPYALWLDLETAGLEPPILEVGAAMVENRFPFPDVEHYSAVVRPDVPGWREKMVPFVVEMHTKTGLLDAVPQGRPLVEVEDELLAMLDRYVDPTAQVVLAGSGVSHFDHEIIKSEMPRLAKRLRYATLDVGVIRRAFEFVGRKAVTEVYGQTFTSPAPEAQQHRALADVLDHLNEWRHYARMLARVPGPDRLVAGSTSG